jgi:hypothetical protein
MREVDRRLQRWYGINRELAAAKQRLGGLVVRSALPGVGDDLRAEVRRLDREAEASLRAVCEAMQSANRFGLSDRI